MMQSLRAHRPFASKPFELLEGGFGYVMYRPVPHERMPPDAPQDFAMLVVKGDDMIGQEGSEFHITLAFLEDPSAKLVSSPAIKESVFSLYTFQNTLEVMNEFQPLLLTIKWDVKWRAFTTWTSIGTILAGLLLSFCIARRFSKAHYRILLDRYERTQLYNQANFDVLTGLPNTNLLMDRAEQALLMAERSGNIVAICYLDLDKFKEVNDTWGHDAGDELLIQMSSRLQSALRSEDTIARIHGDEFIILLPDLEEAAAIEQVTPKLLSVFEKPFDIDGQILSLTGSVGVATYPKDGQDLETLISISDKRMYLNKASIRYGAEV